VLEWDYTWHAGRPVALHLHDRDSVQVFSEGGSIRSTTTDGKAETKVFAPKDTRFIARGTIDAEEAVSGTPRAVTIELK
jgi:lipid A disaccharide synthetase